MRTQARSGPRSDAGFTVVELVLSLVIAALLTTGAAMAAAEGRDAFRYTRQRSTLEAELRRALGLARRELLDTGLAVLTPDPGSALGTSSLLFQRAQGLDGGGIAWGPFQRLAFEYEEGEANDGVDNDGDTLVDEGMLVLTRDEGGPGEVRVVLCRGVRERLEGETVNGSDDNGNGVTDENGFSVHRVGDLLFLRLTLEDPQRIGGSLARTLTTSVLLRNPVE